MKHLIKLAFLSYTLFALTFVFSTTSGQTLPPIVFNIVPSCLQPTQTVTLGVNSVPGATGYIFETDSTAINALLFNNNLSPILSESPNVDLTGVLPSLFYKVYITAVSPCCTSATRTATISGTGNAKFDDSNSLFANPNSIQNYTVNVLCSTPALYNWSLSGDVTFSNGNQTISTSGKTVPLYFGSAFGTGTLCVDVVNTFGLHLPTICTDIYNPNYLND